MNYVYAPGNEILDDMRDSFTIYDKALSALDRGGIPYVIGGGIAVMSYSRRRVTKDLDVYIEPQMLTKALSTLSKEGFSVNEMPDVAWLAKAFMKGVTIDFILENIGGILATPETIEHGRYMSIGEYRYFVMCPEDLILRKLLAMHSERDDWYDSIAVFAETYRSFDWDYFFRIIMGFEARVLSFLLFVISDRERTIPVPCEVIDALAQKIQCHK